MKQTGMLVVSLGGVNFWILVSLRVFRGKHQYFMYACIGYDDHVFISLKSAHCMSYLFVFKQSPLGVKICLRVTASKDRAKLEIDPKIKILKLCQNKSYHTPD